MRPGLIGLGLLAGASAGAVGAAVLSRPSPEGPPAVDRARLAAVANAHLPDPRDSAVIMDLDRGELVLAHHPDALSQRRILPGSVLKLFTAYALAEQGLEDRRFTCTGSHTDPHGVERPCWRRDGHGPMKLRTAIAESCNVWFHEQSARLSDRGLLEVFRRFGLGAPWEARPDAPLTVKRDLVPAAIPARDLPDVAIGDHVSLRVTPLSLLRAVSVIATRGRRLEPRSVRGPCGPPACETLDLDPRILERIAEGMREATASGTLADVFDPAASVAAKTGTAKKWAVRGMRGLVVGFLPEDAPRYGFVVVKDRGQGARDAGPPAAALVDVLTAPSGDGPTP